MDSTNLIMGLLGRFNIAWKILEFLQVNFSFSTQT
jgi:hypothetical protein